MVLSLTGIIGGCSSNKNQTNSEFTNLGPGETSTSGPDVSSSEGETPKSAEATDAVLVDDSVVNHFIISYNSISSSPFTDIKEGNIRTKYYAYSYTYYFELQHSDDTDNIDITINETNENSEEGIKGMKNAFEDTIHALNPSLSSKEIDGYFNNLVDGNLSFDSYIHNNLEVNQELDGIAVAYSPDADLSYGHSRGHITIIALN